MSEKDLIKELDSIIGYADGLKKKAEGLRVKLARFHAPASPKGADVKKEIEAVLMRRNKFLNKKSLAQTRPS